MLLKLKDKIINSDQIIKVEYFLKSGHDASLFIYLVDAGNRQSPQVRDNVIMLHGVEANLMWSALSQIATPVVPKQPSQSS